MTPTEHLERIKQKCLANLAIAEKRTPGEWTATIAEPNFSGHPPADASVHAHGDMRGQVCGQSWNHDAVYIAACAGAAEAGWRSTIAAIEGLRKIAWVEASGNRDHSWTGEQAFVTLNAIIAAWPEELLK